MAIASPAVTAGHPSSIAEAIADAPGLAERLLAEHADDGTGHCRVCTAGPQAGRQKYPCRLREIAEQANTLLPGGPR